MPPEPQSNFVGEVLLGAGLVVGGLALLVVACAVVAVAFGFLIAPRMGRPLAYGGAVGVIEALGRPFLRIVHRAKYVGFDEAALPKGGFIIVANHGSGIDALLLQFALHRPVRFMMAADQMAAAGARLWKALAVLPVRYGPEDAGVLRQAIRHVKDGGIVGIFPEQGIAKDARTIEAFAEGAGAVVALTRAPVVLCWIHGPRTIGSAIVDPFVPRGRAIIEVVGVYDMAAEGVREPAAICERLRAELASKSGWRPLRKMVPGTPGTI